jgi:hypothetical protein
MRFPREYWMIYSGQAFWPCLIWLLPHLPSPVSTVDDDTQKKLRKRATCWQERGGGGGAKPNDREKVWSSKLFNTLWRLPLHWLNAKFNFQPYNESRASGIVKTSYSVFLHQFWIFLQIGIFVAPYHKGLLNKENRSWISRACTLFAVFFFFGMKDSAERLELIYGQRVLRLFPREKYLERRMKTFLSS